MVKKLAPKFLAELNMRQKSSRENHEAKSYCKNTDYLDKLSHVQVVIKCLYSVAQLCTCEDMLVYISGAPSIDDVMSSQHLH